MRSRKPFYPILKFGHKVLRVEPGALPQDGLNDRKDVFCTMRCLLSESSL